MTETQRFEAMPKELEFLRAEMELNRKYIFERPLLIVLGGITAAASLESLKGFEILPLLFMALMGYNLWFTYNRLQSNGRIVSYLQVVYTPSGVGRWIGWEAALHEFRKHPLPDSFAPGLRKTQDENRFYGPILGFHVVAVGFLTVFLLVQSRPVGGGSGFSQEVVGWLSGAMLLAFFVVAWWFRPAKVRYTIDRTREVWEMVLPPTAEASPRAVAEVGGDDGEA